MPIRILIVDDHALLRGKFEMVSVPGKGTRIDATFPKVEKGE